MVAYGVNIVRKNKMRIMLPIKNIIADNTTIKIEFNGKFRINMIYCFFPIKCRFANRLNAVRNINFNKIISACKCITAYGNNRVGQRKLGITPVIIECIIPDSLKRRRESDITD